MCRVSSVYTVYTVVELLCTGKEQDVEVSSYQALEVDLSCLVLL